MNQAKKREPGDILVSAIVSLKKYEGEPISPDGPFDVSPLAEKQFIGFVIQHDKTGEFLEVRPGFFLPLWGTTPFAGTIFYNEKHAQDQLDYYEKNRITGKDFRLEVTIKKVTLIV